MNENRKIKNITINTGNDTQLTKILNILAYIEACSKHNHDATMKINISGDDADITVKFDNEDWQKTYEKILELWEYNIESRGNYRVKVDSYFDISNN